MFSSQKTLVIYICLIVISVSLSACIVFPVKWDKPAKESSEKIKISLTKKSEVHDYLGEPYRSLDELELEIYKFSGGEAKYFAAGWISIPFAGTSTERLLSYVLISYEKDIVAGLDYGSDQGDRKIELPGYEYLIGEEILVSTKNFNMEELHFEAERQNKCTAYVLPNSDLALERYDVDGELLGVSTDKGYLRKLLDPGRHEIIIQYLTHKKYKEHYDSQIGSFEFLEYKFTLINSEFSCSSNEKIYLQLENKKPKESSEIYELVKHSIPPEEIFRKQLVLYQEMPPWTNYSKP